MGEKCPTSQPNQYGKNGGTITKPETGPFRFWEDPMGKERQRIPPGWDHLKKVERNETPFFLLALLEQDERKELVLGRRWLPRGCHRRPGMGLDSFCLFRRGSAAHIAALSSF